MGGFKCYNKKQDEYKVDYEIHPIGAARLVQATIKNCFTEPGKNSKMSNEKKIEFFQQHISFAMLEKNLLIHHFCDVFDIDETKLRLAIFKFNSDKIKGLLDKILIVW